MENALSVWLRITKNSLRSHSNYGRPLRGSTDLLPRIFRRCPFGRYPLYPLKKEEERFGPIVQMHANQRDEIKEVYAGDIAAAVGLKEVTTGDTLCDPNHIIVLERMEFP